MADLFAKWRSGLAKTSKTTFGRIATLFGATDITQDTWDDLEALLIQADSFRHPEKGLVGAMGDEDVARAKEVLPPLEVERWHSAHVVHLAAPKRYVAALTRLAARAG